MEYSAKHRVSLSTLRRRIKAGEVEHKLIEGKYLLKDAALPQSQTTQAPTLIPTPNSTTTPTLFPTVPITLTTPRPAGPETIAPPQPMSSQHQPVTPAAGHDKSLESESQNVWATTQNLLGEIKKAYALILQEKQQQIFQLKEEAADLRTLVRVLEDENQRLRNSMPSLDLDLGLEA
jgi:hypothetical protein